VEKWRYDGEYEMSKATHAAAKADTWFQAYLAMGDNRSLRKLAAEIRQRGGTVTEEYAPALRTLESWSAKYDWDRRAREHDAEVMERARNQLLRRRAGLAEERVEIALAHTLAFHMLVRSGLTREETTTDVMDDGSIREVTTSRPATFAEMSKVDLHAIITLHNTAVATERALLAGASDRYRANLAEQGEQGAGVTVLGPEALMEMGTKIGSLVRKLSATTERRKAERADATVVQTSSEQPVFNDDDPDDPGLEWEEVDEDE